MFRNVLIMEKEQFNNVKGRTDSLAQAIKLLIAINEDGETFDVIQNEWGPNSLDVPISMLDAFVKDQYPCEFVSPGVYLRDGGELTRL